MIDIPPNFERDVKHGRRRTIQVNVDAPLWRGRVAVPTYIQEILAQEIADAIYHGQKPPAPPLTLVVRAKFNPNLTFSWFIGVMHIVNDIILLAMFLRGAAVIREREHGTLEHLLAMPLRPSEIMLAKAWANGLVIVAAAMLSLLFVVRWLLRVPIAGSAVLFAGGGDIPLFRNFTGYPDRHVGWLVRCRSSDFWRSQSSSS